MRDFLIRRHSHEECRGHAQCTNPKLEIYLRLLSLVVATVLTGGSALAANTIRFQDNFCRIAFRYSSDWEVVKNQDHGMEQHRCWLNVRPKNLKLPLTQDENADDYTIAVIVDDVGFEEELQHFAYFERANGRWFGLGRLDVRSPAEAITGRGWSGVKGTATVGCYAEHGGYEGYLRLTARNHQQRTTVSESRGGSADANTI